MQQSADGVWTVLLPLTAGVHDYGFIIDGERWVADPYAPEVDDGFGGVNSRLTVLAPADRL
jgi:1,4-alpha-glucan branching enzyme